MASPQQQFLFERLDTVFQRAQKATIPTAFFPALYEYVDIIDGKKLLLAIIHIIIEDGKEAMSTVKELEVSLDAILNQAFEKVKHFIEQNNITDVGILSDLSECEAAIKDRMLTSTPFVAVKFYSLTLILDALAQNSSLQKELRPFLEQFGELLRASMTITSNSSRIK